MSAYKGQGTSVLLGLFLAVLSAVLLIAASSGVETASAQGGTITGCGGKGLPSLDCIGAIECRQGDTQCAQRYGHKDGIQGKTCSVRGPKNVFGGGTCCALQLCRDPQTQDGKKIEKSADQIRREAQSGTYDANSPVSGSTGKFGTGLQPLPGVIVAEPTASQQSLLKMMTGENVNSLGDAFTNPSNVINALGKYMQQFAPAGTGGGFSETLPDSPNADFINNVRLVGEASLQPSIDGTIIDTSLRGSGEFFPYAENTFGAGSQTAPNAIPWYEQAMLDVRTALASGWGALSEIGENAWGSTSFNRLWDLAQQNDSRQAFFDAAEVFCQLDGCQPTLAAQAMMATCFVESIGCRANIPHPGSAYQGLMQHDIGARNRALATLQSLVQNPNLSETDRVNVAQVVRGIQDQIDRGINPGRDPQYGAWLGAARFSDLSGTPENRISALEAITRLDISDPRTAAAVLQLSQFAPSTFSNPNFPDAPLSGSPRGALWALEQNRIYLSPGATAADAVDAIENSSRYSAYFARGIAFADGYVPPLSSPYSYSGTLLASGPSVLSPGLGESLADSSFGGSIPPVYLESFAIASLGPSTDWGGSGAGSLDTAPLPDFSQYSEIAPAAGNLWADSSRILATPNDPEGMADFDAPPEKTFAQNLADTDTYIQAMDTFIANQQERLADYLPSSLRPEDYPLGVEVPPEPTNVFPDGSKIAERQLPEPESGAAGKTALPESSGELGKAAQMDVRQPPPGDSATNLYQWFREQGKPLPSVQERSTDYDILGRGDRYIGSKEQNDELRELYQRGEREFQEARVAANSRVQDEPTSAAQFDANDQPISPPPSITLGPDQQPPQLPPVNPDRDTDLSPEEWKANEKAWNDAVALNQYIESWREDGWPKLDGIPPGDGVAEQPVSQESTGKEQPSDTSEKELQDYINRLKTAEEKSAEEMAKFAEKSGPESGKTSEEKTAEEKAAAAQEASPGANAKTEEEKQVDPAAKGAADKLKAAQKEVAKYTSALAKQFNDLKAGKEPKGSFFSTMTKLEDARDKAQAALSEVQRTGAYSAADLQKIGRSIAKVDSAVKEVGEYKAYTWGLTQGTVNQYWPQISRMIKSGNVAVGAMNRAVNAPLVMGYTRR